jgi:hypothetical protein
MVDDLGRFRTTAVAPALVAAGGRTVAAAPLAQAFIFA